MRNLLVHRFIQWIEIQNREISLSGAIKRIYPSNDQKKKWILYFFLLVEEKWRPSYEM